MVVFYFSGTGNSRFVAEHFAAAAGAACYSIEEPLDAAVLLRQEEVVAFCYPVYGSCVAGPMRSFVQAHQDELQGKRFVILATQLIFSGDGDFTTLVEALQRKGRKVSVVSTMATQPPMIADDLRRQSDHFIDLISLKAEIGRDPSERPVRQVDPSPASETEA